MGNIVLLDDLTINKIAAGEVIERPASVVKELVENSIDAGANNISIEVKNGGISYIRITDNGKGILPDDMEIAFERHATSKIRKAEDLNDVKSMGFRGEALASIAAIARVEMVSRTADSSNGYRIVVEGGNVIIKEEIGCPKGTTITVENLFFNTPVRYKFLKKDYTESGYIEDAIQRIALVNTDIAVKLINNGKKIIQTSGNGDIKDVIYGIYGKDVADNLIDVNYNYGDMVVTGVIGKPSIARSNRANQLFFVNKRYVKDKTLSSATEQAYKGMVTIGKYGFVVLNIEMNPNKVDVNVHPAKLEVRFENESEVFKLIYHAIKESLLKCDFIGRNDNIDNTYEEKNTSSEKVFEYGKTQNNFFKNIISKKHEKQDFEEQHPETNIVEQLYNQKTGLNDVIDIYEKSESKEQYSYSIDNNSNQNVNKYDFEKNADAKDSENSVNERIINESSIDESNINENTISESIENNDIENQIIEEKKSPIDEVEEQIRKMTNQNVDLEEQLKQSSNEFEEQLNKQEENEIQNDNTSDFEEMYIKTFGKKPKNISEIEEENEKYIPEALSEMENISVFANSEVQLRPNYKIIGVAFKTYIILEMDEEMYILDQHAAHERILYEKVKQNYYNSTKDTQIMLLPDIIELTHKEMGILRDNVQLFIQSGFEIEEFGENTIKLTGVPNICIDLDTKELFLETLDEINTVARTAKQEIEEKFIATVACKSAVKANMALSIQEIDALLQKLLLLKNPFTCPHGRPTAIKMSKTEIEKKFSRR